MQAFAYHHFVPAQQWLVAGIERPVGVPLTLCDGQTVKLPVGGTAAVHFLGPHGPKIARVAVRAQRAARRPPLQRTSFTDDGLDVVFRADPAKVKPGWRGNLIVEAFVMRTVDPNNAKSNNAKSKDGKAKPFKRRVSLGMLPAVVAGGRIVAGTLRVPFARYGTRRSHVTAHGVCLLRYGQLQSGVTPFFRMMLPYLAVSPVITTAKAALARS